MSAVVSAVEGENQDYEAPDSPDDEILETEEQELLEEEPEASFEEDGEAEARKQGWRPLNEYRGKAGGWVDARTFLDRGKQFLPFVQKDLRETRAAMGRVEAENANLRAELAEQREVLQELREFARNATQNGYNQARRDIEERMRTAVSEGDTGAYDQAKQELDSLVEGRAEQSAAGQSASQPPAPAPRPQPQAQAALRPEVEAFMAANPWFKSDPVLNAVMIAEHERVSKDWPGMDLAENLEEAKAAVVARFPEKFGRPQAQRPSAPRTRTVMAPRGHVPAGQRRDSFESIADPVDREDAKRAFARMKRQMPDMTAAEYMAIYNNPRADALTMRRAAAAKGK